MENKKFELTEETKVIGDRTVYRIRALKSFGNVKKFDLGGFVEKESNLAQYGTSWIYYGDACVMEEAKVSEDAKIYDNALISGNARVYGSAGIFGNALCSGFCTVSDNASITGNAHVTYAASVSGNAYVRGNAFIGKRAFVCGDAQVDGYAQITGKAKITDKAKVFGDAMISGNAEIAGECEIGDGAMVSCNADLLFIMADYDRQGHITAYRTKDSMSVCKNGNRMTLEEYEKYVKENELPTKKNELFYESLISMLKAYFM